MDAVRHTARAIILNPYQEMLLISVKLPWLSSPIWTLPGGGIEVGESATVCVRREIFEETGHTYQGELTPGWHGTIEFLHEGNTYEVHEQYFVARVDHRFTPSMEHMLDYEKDFTLEMAWRSTQQIAAAGNHCSPKQLPDMLTQACKGLVKNRSELITDLMPDNYRP